MKKMYLYALLILTIASYINAARPKDTISKSWDTVSFDGTNYYPKHEITTKWLQKRYGFTKQQCKKILNGSFKGQRVTYYRNGKDMKKDTIFV